MTLKSSSLVWAGVAAIGVLGGVTYALVQPTPQASPVASVSPVTASPSATPKPDTPTAVDDSPSAPTIQPARQSIQSSTDAPAPAEATRQITKCVTSMAVVSDPNPPLNVRSNPVVNADNVVGQLKNNTFVTVVDQQDNWFQISTPLRGWISKDRTESGCNQKVEQIEFAPKTNSTTIADRFIGTGSHEYILGASQGQTMTITQQKGPFPTIVSPSGDVLVGNDPGDAKRTSWTGTLPSDGQYKIMLDSNYRGYRYSFVVQIR